MKTFLKNSWCLAFLFSLLMADALYGHSGQGNAEKTKVEDAAKEPGSPVRVLIIGDSISMQGYTKWAAETLDGEMLLHHHEGNAQNSRNCLEKMDDWLAETGGDWDIIHFNCGLWDLRQGGTEVPLAEYTANMEKIVARLKQTEARLIFATTTPVPDKNGMKRRDTDVQAYNAAAAEIMKREEIAINDLYEFIAPTLAEHQIKSNVHFNQAGYQRLAESVVKSLRKSAEELPQDLPQEK